MFTEERALWLYRNYCWLDENLPKRQDSSTKTSGLILPTAQFYPMPKTRDHAFAQVVFDQTRDYMGVLDWPCTLTAQTEEEKNLGTRDAGLYGYNQTNTAFEFGQWGDAQFSGWQSSSRGYLSEAELGFALGIFSVRNRLNPDDVMKFLKPNPAEIFWDSIDYIETLERPDVSHRAF